MVLFKRIAIILLSCSLLISSCSVLGLFPEPTHAPRSEWITKWLNDPTCDPPCFENITPGKITLDEALGIAQKLPGVRIITLPTFMGKDYMEKQMQWVYNDLSFGGTVSVNTDQSGMTVNWINLNFSANQYLMLQEIFSAFGQPDRISIDRCEPHALVSNCFVHLLIQNKGLLINLVLPDLGKKDARINILPSSLLSDVVLIPLKTKVFAYSVKNKPFDFEKDFREWKGFGFYPFGN